MDLGSALESGTGTVAQPRCRTAATVWRLAARGAGGGGKAAGAWARVSLRGEILGAVCRRAIAQPDHQPQPCAAGSAPPEQRTASAQRALQEGTDRAQDQPLAICPLLAEIVRYQLEEDAQGWQLQFDYDSEAFARLLKERLGRTVLLTNRLDWTAEQVAAGYGGQQSIERVFRGLKDGDWLGWGPMHHWTDRKIRIHAFYCMLGISLLHYLHKKAQAVWADLSIEQLLEELEQIKQFVLLYPTQGEKGPARAAYVLSQQTLTQQALVKALGLERLHRSTPRG